MRRYAEAKRANEALEKSQDSPEPGETRTAASAVSVIREAFGKFRHGQGVGAVLARGAVGVLIVGLFATAVSFGVQMLLARLLGAANYGIYAYALSWLNVLIFAATFDLDEAAPRFVGEYNGTRNWSLLRGFIRRSHQIVAAISCTLGLIGGTVAWSLRGRLGAEVAGVFVIVSAMLPVMAMAQFKTGVLKGFRRVVLAKIPVALVRPLVFGLGLVVVTYGVGLTLGPRTALLLNLGASSFALILAWFLLSKTTPSVLRRSSAEYRTRVWLGVSGSFLLISASQVVLTLQADVFIIGSLIGSTEAGLYTVATLVALPLTFGFAAVIFIAEPMVAELFAQRRRGELQRALSLAGWANAAMTVPLFVLVAVLGKLFLGLFGSAFAVGYPVLLVIAASHVVSGLGGAMAGHVVTMTGHHAAGVRIVGSSAVLNIVLTLALIPFLGMMGAAVGTFLATLFRSTVLIIYIRERLRLAVVPFQRVKR